MVQTIERATSDEVKPTSPSGVSTSQASPEGRTERQNSVAQRGRLRASTTNQYTSEALDENADGSGFHGDIRGGVRASEIALVRREPQFPPRRILPSSYIPRPHGAEDAARYTRRSAHR